MSSPDSVLVVGASAAGLSTAEALRRKGFTGSITILGAEKHAPYDRPPLSKQVLSGAWEPERTTLRPEASLAELGAEFVLGDPAVGFDAQQRTVRTESGRALRADVVVAATGVRPRMLPGQALEGVHVLRTLDDALALRSDLRPGARVVVVGEGVLGSEIAATARGLGLDVTMAGPQPAPMAAQLGPMVGGRLAELHAGRGVRLRLSAGVDGFTSTDGRVTGVRLDSGETLPADVVVVAIGAEPITDWLTDVPLDNGVVCDSRCRAADGLYAVGDLARWWHEPSGEYVRMENRTNATFQAATVAANILGADQPYSPTPYFWTDQYDVKLQIYGFLPADAEVTIVDGEQDPVKFVARYVRNGRIIGVLGWNMAKQARLRSKEIGTPVDA